MCLISRVRSLARAQETNVRRVQRDAERHPVGKKERNKSVHQLAEKKYQGDPKAETKRMGNSIVL